LFIGPIHPAYPGLSSGHSPVKPIKVSNTTGKQVVLFDQEYTYALQSGPVAIDAGGPSRDEALKTLVRVATAMRVQERQRRLKRQN
jgi:hypothetical protein